MLHKRSSTAQKTSVLVPDSAVKVTFVLIMLPQREAPQVQPPMLGCLSERLVSSVPPPTTNTTASALQWGPLRDEVASGLNTKPGHSPDH